MGKEERQRLLSEKARLMEILNQESWLSRISSHSQASRLEYKAMYSTWWDGIVTDPNLMLIPIDDHQVHRGDGVFEAMKAVEGGIYLAAEHLDRLERSARALGLKNPFSRPELEGILKETLRASGLRQGILRLFLGRGPGSFSTNPYDSSGAQLHVVATELKALSDAKIRSGVSLALSAIPPKESWLAQIKSCNYLTNVMMKKEAVDLGVDFTVGVDAEGFITEGSTENLLILNREGCLLRPPKTGILAGTTMMRVFELSSEVPEIISRDERGFRLDDLLEAREIFMAGTTLDVIAVTSLQGRPLGAGGAAGPVAIKLRELMLKEQASGTRSLRPF